MSKKYYCTEESTLVQKVLRPRRKHKCLENTTAQREAHTRACSYSAHCTATLAKRTTALTFQIFILYIFMKLNKMLYIVLTELSEMTELKLFVMCVKDYADTKRTKADTGPPTLYCG